MSQENIDEIPVLQGSYNDSIIIENKDDPLKVESISDFSESSDQLTKKKKKHSKRSEQKKLKPRCASKNKRKQVSIPTFSHASTLNIPNTNVQCKNITLPEICIPRCSVKDISNNQGKVNVLPGNIISVGNELSMINIKDKTVVNITNSGQMMNLAHSDDKSTEKLMNNAAENRTTISTTTNIKNIPILFASGSATNTVQNLSTVAHKGTNPECQSESAKPIAQNINTSTSTNYKNLLKAPKLSILKTAYDTSRLTPQTQVDNIAANEKNVQPIVDVPKTWISQETKTVPGVSFLANPAFSQGPPILQNEMTRCDTIRPASFKPSLENIQLPVGTVISQVYDRNLHPFFNTSLPTLFHKRFAEFRPKKPNPSSGCKTLIKEANWGNGLDLNSLDSNTNANILRITVPPASKQDSIRISSTLPNLILPANVSAVQTYPMYTSAQITSIDSNKAYLISSTNYSTDSTNVYPKVTAMTKEYKNSSRQKSQRGGQTSRKRPARNTKSNNNSSSSVSQTNTTSTSVGTQIDKPISVLIDQSCVNIPPSRVTNNIVQSLTHTSSDSSSVANPVVVNPAQRNETECSNIPDNKTQLTNLQKPTDNINPHLSASNLKSKKVSTVRRKSKEKLKKVTMEKKELSTTSSTSETTKEQSVLIQSTDVQLCSTQAPSIIPGHISEMIYPNVPSSDLLRAFNDYWNAQISHCAICAPFASCNSGSSRVMPPDWKYCKPIVLPKSTPIWVRFFFYKNY